MREAQGLGRCRIVHRLGSLPYRHFTSTDPKESQPGNSVRLFECLADQTPESPRLDSSDLGRRLDSLHEARLKNDPAKTTQQRLVATGMAPLPKIPLKSVAGYQVTVASAYPVAVVPHCSAGWWRVVLTVTVEVVPSLVAEATPMALAAVAAGRPLRGRRRRPRRPRRPSPGRAGARPARAHHPPPRPASP